MGEQGGMHEGTKQGVSRRGLLKVIAAAGGTAAVASALPERWIRPLVERGATPAHAQTSGPRPVIMQLEVGPGNDPNSSPANGPAKGVAFEWLMARFVCEDSLEEFDDTSTLTASLDCGVMLFEDKPIKDILGADLSGAGDPTRTKAEIPFQHFCNGPVAEFCVSVTAGGRVAQEVCLTYNMFEFGS
jgi:hypothetical protein